MARELLGAAALALAVLGAGWEGSTPAAAPSPDRSSSPVATPAATPAARSAAIPAPTTASQGDAHEAGRSVYNFRCYFCHGYSGDAKTLAATYLAPPPRDFTAGGLTREQIEVAVRTGRPGTAMAAFAGVLGEAEIAAVSAFVEREFVRDRAPNTSYHTAANGWPRHERHAAAFPFARGEIAIDTSAEELTEVQRAGRRLFMTSCISCHDRAKVLDPGPAWAARPLSYPRAGFQPAEPVAPGQPSPPPPDAVSSASVYARHDVPPKVAGLTARERRGERLFQANCAFCHGADGSGKNWIGQFMEPKARDLTAYSVQTMPNALLEQRIREGLPGTSMPAWQHVLSAAQIRDLAAYVTRALFRGGSGDREVAAAR